MKATTGYMNLWMVNFNQKKKEKEKSMKNFLGMKSLKIKLEE